MSVTLWLAFHRLINDALSSCIKLTLSKNCFWNFNKSKIISKYTAYHVLCITHLCTYVPIKHVFTQTTTRMYVWFECLFREANIYMNGHLVSIVLCHWCVHILRRLNAKKKKNEKMGLCTAWQLQKLFIDNITQCFFTEFEYFAHSFEAFELFPSLILFVTYRNPFLFLSYSSL